MAARDPRASATFLAEILGLDAPTRFGPFMVVGALVGLFFGLDHDQLIDHALAGRRFCINLVLAFLILWVLFMARGQLEATGAAEGPTAKRPYFTFPIVGGKVDKNPLGGRIVHSGGLSFSAGSM